MADNHSKPTILLVEDDAAFSYAASKYLLNAGYQVITVPTSMAALGELDRLNQKDHDIACLVLDIMMPKGMPHGIALAGMARQHDPTVPIVFITAYSDMEQIAKEYGAACLVKPVDFEALVAAVHKQIEMKHVA